VNKPECYLGELRTATLLKLEFMRDLRELDGKLQ